MPRAEPRKLPCVFRVHWWPETSGSPGSTKCPVLGTQLSTRGTWTTRPTWQRHQGSGSMPHGPHFSRDSETGNSPAARQPPDPTQGSPCSKNHITPGVSPPWCCAL